MRRAGRAAAATLAASRRASRPASRPADIDAWVREDTARRGGRPSQLGYHGFPAAVCTSRNDVVCHGIPSRRERLAPGDIINVDVTTELDGFHGDTSATLFVGAARAPRRGTSSRRPAAAATPASPRSAPARAWATSAPPSKSSPPREGCSVVRELGGHGIGRAMHAPPHVAHVGQRGTGLRLREGMAITIEPMINLGRPRRAAARRRLDDRHRRRLAVRPVRAHGARHARRLRGPHPALTPSQKKRAALSIRSEAVRRPGRRRQEP